MDPPFSISIISGRGDKLISIHFDLTSWALMDTWFTVRATLPDTFIRMMPTIFGVGFSFEKDVLSSTACFFNRVFFSCVCAGDVIPPWLYRETIDGNQLATLAFEPGLSPVVILDSWNFPCHILQSCTWSAWILGLVYYHGNVDSVWIGTQSIVSSRWKSGKSYVSSHKISQKTATVHSIACCLASSYWNIYIFETP